MRPRLPQRRRIRHRPIRRQSRQRLPRRGEARGFFRLPIPRGGQFVTRRSGIRVQTPPQIDRGRRQRGERFGPGWPVRHAGPRGRQRGLRRNDRLFRLRAHRRGIAAHANFRQQDRDGLDIHRRGKSRQIAIQFRLLRHPLANRRVPLGDSGVDPRMFLDPLPRARQQSPRRQQIGGLFGRHPGTQLAQQVADPGHAVVVLTRHRRVIVPRFARLPGIAHQRRNIFREREQSPIDRDIARGLFGTRQIIPRDPRRFLPRHDIHPRRVQRCPKIVVQSRRAWMRVEPTHRLIALFQPGTHPADPFQPGGFGGCRLRLGIARLAGFFQRVEFALPPKPIVRFQCFRAGAASRCHEPVQRLIKRPRAGFAQRCEIVALLFQPRLQCPRLPEAARRRQQRAGDIAA